VPPPGGGAHETEAPVDFLEQACWRRTVLRVQAPGAHEQRHDQQRTPGHPPESHAGTVASAIPARYPRKIKFFLAISGRNQLHFCDAANVQRLPFRERAALNIRR
jgi:hypothetical protein